MADGLARALQTIESRDYGVTTDGSIATARLPRRCKCFFVLRLVGVGDGYRTRDLLSHSQAFCH